MAFKPDLTKLVEPRVIVMKSGVSHNLENTQDIDLVALTREASVGFLDRFSKEGQRDLNEKMKFAGDNSLTWLGKKTSSLSATKRVKIPQIKYHLGHVFTEQEAYDLGFFAPHVDTQCARIGQLAHDYTQRNKWMNGEAELEEQLRALDLITQDQTIMLHDGFHVIRKDQVGCFRYGQVKGMNSSQRPITLNMFGATRDPENDQLHIPIGYASFVESVNCVYMFMTHPPVLD